MRQTAHRDHLLGRPCRFEFVHGVTNPEDLARLPGTPWVVASHLNINHLEQKIGVGPLQAIRIDTRKVHSLYPTPDSSVDWDRATYPDRALPAEIFSPVGLNVRSLGQERFRLYVANHGGGKSVEIVDVLVRGAGLHASWRGSIPVPEVLGVWPNGVAPLPGNGVVLSGTGTAMWYPDTGWKAIDSRRGRSSNGVEVSRDGQWLFVADTASRSVVRIGVGTGEEQTLIENLGFFSDNLRWGEDGFLYVAGPDWPEGFPVEESFKKTVCDLPFGIAQIDPRTLSWRTIFRSQGIPGVFGAATTALQTDDAFWIGTVRGDRIMILPIDKIRDRIS